MYLFYSRGSNLEQLKCQWLRFNELERIHGTYIKSNSELGAHVKSDIDYLIYLRHLDRLRAVTNLFFPCSEIPSNISTIDITVNFNGSRTDLNVKKISLLHCSSHKSLKSDPTKKKMVPDTFLKI